MFDVKLAFRIPMVVAGLAGSILLLAVVWRWPPSPSRSWRANGSDAVTDVALSFAADRLVCGDHLGHVQVYAAESGQPISHWKSTDSPVTALALSADDRLLAVAHRDGTVTCREVRTGPLLLQFNVPEILALKFSPDGHSLAVASRNGVLKIVRDLAETVEIVPAVPKQIIRAIRFSSDSRFIAMAVGRHVEVWRVDNLVMVMRSPELALPASALEFMSDGSEVVALQPNCSLTRWRISDGAMISTVPGRHGFQYPMVGFPNLRIVAVAGMRGCLRILDVEDGSELQVLQERGREIVALGWSSDGRWLSAADDRNQVRSWSFSEAAEDSQTWRRSIEADRRALSRVIVAGIGLCLVLTVLAALADWPTALIACVLLETIRDPVRKFDSSEVLFLSVSVVWLIVAGIAIFRSRSAIVSLDQRFPELKLSAVLMGIALIPGSVMSVTSLPAGWVLAAGGACSYLMPFLGIALGAACVSRPGMVTRFLAVFAAGSAIGGLSALPESSLWNMPGLGGRGFVWYRSFPVANSQIIQTVPLICGIYRSPDALGLHAALGLIFLFAVYRPPFRGRTGVSAALLILGLFLSGRRKMLVIPIIFGFGALLAKVRKPTLRRSGPAMVAFVAGAVLVMSIAEHVPNSWYLSTVMRDVGPRAVKSLGASLETCRQFGFWGAGLGTATQGMSQLVRHDLRIWQEDGLSRAVVELGVAGVCIALVALGLVFRMALRAWSLGTDANLIRWMLLAALANAASYWISHQMLGGDVPMLLLTSMCLGIAFGEAEKPVSA